MQNKKKTESAYDVNKGMMNTIRNMRKLNEDEQGQQQQQQQQPQQGQQAQAQPDILRELSDVEKAEEENKFKEAVTYSVIFDKKITVGKDNVDWGGQIPNHKITWAFGLDSDNGCYISCDMMQVTDEALKVLQNLTVYYDIWAQYWQQEILK